MRGLLFITIQTVSMANPWHEVFPPLKKQMCALEVQRSVICSAQFVSLTFRTANPRVAIENFLECFEIFFQHVTFLTPQHDALRLWAIRWLRSSTAIQCRSADQAFRFVLDCQNVLGFWQPPSVCSKARAEQEPARRLSGEQRWSRWCALQVWIR